MRIALLSVVIGALVLAAAELLLLGAMHMPNLGRHTGPLYTELVDFYVRKLRALSQTHMRWDPAVTYTMVPGDRFRLSNVEYDVEMTANALGVRDDEDSLVQPDIVVVGDSFAMGEGVGHDDTFARQLETLTGLKVLNLGVSSYATYREMKLLERADLSRVKMVVVQYCPNDVGENRTYYDKGNKLPITPRDRFEQSVQANQEMRRYRFGDALRWLGTHMGQPAAAQPSPQTRELGLFKHAQSFLNALSAAPEAARQAQWIILDAVDRSDTAVLGNYPEYDTTRFLGAVRGLVAAGGQPDFVQRARLVDLSSRLTEADYYVWDGHWRASGHRKAAEAIAAAMTATEWHQPEPFLGQHTSPQFRAQLAAPLPKAAVAGTLACSPASGEITPGQPLEVTLRLTNDSPFAWPGADVLARQPINIRPHLLRDGKRQWEFWDGALALPRTVMPGETIDLTTKLTGTTLPAGESKVEFDMVQEGNIWWSQNGVSACTVTVTKKGG